MSATVSVIIPTYNRAQKLIRAVDSVLNQTFRDVEIIVVDDGSEDDTRAVLRRWGTKITVIEHRSRRGPSAARNSGIAQASAPLIAFLDSDDYWLPEKLAVQVSFFQDNPQAMACQTEEIWIRRGRRVNPKKRHKKPSGYMFEASLRLCLISPSAVMLHRSVFQEIGDFDEQLPACEDYDLWLRLTCRWPVSLIPEALVVKEGGHSDQLSSQYWGMDRFRIRAIARLICSGRLRPDQEQAALAELRRKCAIYASGCLKRGKEEERKFFKLLPDNLQSCADKILGSPYLRFH